MQPSICVFGTGRLSKELAKQAKILNLPVDIVFFDAKKIDGTFILPENTQSFDVFLSSGYIGKQLTEMVDKPVVVVKPSIHDTLMAYSKAVKLTDKILVLTYDTDYSELVNIKNLLKYNITQYNYHDIDEKEEIILRYKEMGYACVVGSGETCRLAEKNGLHSSFIFSPSTLRTYLSIAADTAISIRRETSNSNRLESIVNTSKQGMLLTNNTGDIFLCNTTAANFFGKSLKDIIGRNIAEQFPNGEMDNARDLLKLRKGLFVKLNGKRYVADIIPIIGVNAMESLLIYLDDIRVIQDSEQAIRQNLFAKGFVAKHTFDVFTSKSLSFQKVIAIAKKYAKTDEPVVILGETGTGKELVAQSIHNYSQRAHSAFVAVNCSALSAGLLESELFGYEDGAFTGARKGGKEGLFEMAHKGTIFLDEIGDVDTALQIKLLRAIQEKNVMRVGGSKIIPFDARIITATNQDLLQMVREKVFREDLYYRLNVLELNIPPLYERGEDILPLFQQFVLSVSANIASKIKTDKTRIEYLLGSYRWPGNVRELENFSKTFCAMVEPNDKPEQLTEMIEGLMEKKLRTYPRMQPKMVFTETTAVNPRILTSSYRKRRASQALVDCNGQYNEAAKMLGVSRSTLWRWLQDDEAKKMSIR